MSTTRISPSPVGFLEAVPRAFSLAELLIVLVILSTMAGGVMVAVSGRQESFALSTAAKDLASAIRFARQAAVQEHKSFRLVFGDLGQGFRIEETASPAGSSDFKPAPGGAGAWRWFAKGVRIVKITDAMQMGGESPQSITFNPDETGFQGALILENQQKDLLTIEVRNVPGQVEIHP